MVLPLPVTFVRGALVLSSFQVLLVNMEFHAQLW